MFKGFKAAVAGAMALACVAMTPAQAGDPNGDFMVRVLGAGVIPEGNLGGFPTAEVSDEIIPAATLSYFFTPNLAVELFCCFANHTVDLPAPGATGEITDLWIFPPALTLQYHFTGLGATKPYVGVGAQYIHFFEESVGVAAAGLRVTSVDVDDAWGVTLQAGLDHDIGNGWFLNFDVKKTFLETDVKLRTATGTLSYDLDLDPLIVSGGIGYRFNLFNRGTVHQTLK